MSNQLTRIFWLDSELHAGTYPNAGKMMQTFGISHSQAYEDRNALVDIQRVAIKNNAARGGWQYVAPCQPLPMMRITADEAVALRRALLVAETYLGPDDTATLAQFRQRLSSHAHRIAPTTAESAGGAIRSFEGLPTEQWLSACDAALTDRQLLRFLYHSPRQEAPTLRLVRPYHVHNRRGEWCLLAYCEERQAIRTFLLGRMMSVTPASDVGAFAIPPDFDPEQETERGPDLMTGGELVTVVLLFDGYQSRFALERELHHTEQKLELGDGRLQVTMQLAWGYDGEALCRMVLGFGAHVEVLEPTALRDRVRREVDALKKLYD